MTTSNTKSSILLSSQEEKSLFEQYHSASTSDEEKKRIRDKIITAHYPMARARINPLSDKAEGLFNENVLGLLNAFEKFDHTRGNRFCTYAQHYVTASAAQFNRQNRSLIIPAQSKVPKFLHRQYHNIEQSIQNTNPASSYDELCTRVTEYLMKNVDMFKNKTYETLIQDVNDFLITRRPMIHIDQNIDDNTNITYNDIIPDSNTVSPEDKISDEQIQSILKDVFERACQNEDPNLQKRFTTIVYERILADKDQAKTLKDLSPELGVSAERVRQYEERIVRKAREDLLQNHPEFVIDGYTPL